MNFDPEIECPECKGEGNRPIAWVFQNRRHVTIENCPDCNGHGWRAMTEDEINDAAADAWSDLCEGEPPITAKERHEAAWKQKQELNR